MATLLLIPKAVGLVILDSFAFETPLVTTNSNQNGPEIEYLIPEYNGIISEYSLNSYLDSAIALLNAPDKIEKLKNGCRLSAKKFTLEKMVNNFSCGIADCLKYYENQ